MPGAAEAVRVETNDDDETGGEDPLKDTLTLVQLQDMAKIQ